MKNPVGMVGDVTKEGLAAVQDNVDRIHDAFRDHVLEGRREAFTQAMMSNDSLFAKPPAGNYFQAGIQAKASETPSIEQVMDEVASGDVFLGAQALKLGLVDRLITSDEYIAERIRQGCRVLKLVNHHRQHAGLPSLFLPPGHRSLAAGSSMVGIMKRVMHHMTSALLAWADDELTTASTSSVPNVSAGCGTVDDILIR